MGSSSSGSGGIFGGRNSFFRQPFGNKRAASPNGPQTAEGENAARETARQNILADDRFDAGTREQLLNSLATQDPATFNTLYRNLSGNEALLKDRRTAEAGRKLLQDQPGLRKQTTVLAGVQQQALNEKEAKANSKYYGKKNEASILGGGGTGGGTR